MYFPYLKSRGEEANAIKEISRENGAFNKMVLPIIEPFSESEGTEYVNKSIIKMVDELMNANKKFIVIVNNESDLDELKKNYSEDKFYENCIFGFLDFFPEEHNFKKGALIHTSQTIEPYDNEHILFHIFMPKLMQIGESYLDYFPKNKKVYITDAFKKYPSNSDYPAEDIFENNRFCFKYQKLGIAGFGDFTILEENFQAASGGNQPLTTHVIHLTKEIKHLGKKYITVNHFLTKPEEEKDISTRSYLTLKKALEHENDFYPSKGIQIIKNCFKNGSTSLAMYKRIGMLHHIELMNSIVNE